LKPGEEHLFESEKEIILGETPLLGYSNKYVTNTGIILSGLKVEKSGLVWTHHEAIYNSFFCLKQWLKNRRRQLAKSQSAFVCFDYWSDGYFHWICEALPRILSVEEDLLKSDNVLLMPDRYRASFQAQTLKAFPGVKVEWISQEEMLHCPKIFLAQRPAPSGSNNPELMKRLREKIRSTFGNESLDGTRNIYVSRGKARRRKIANESEVIQLLSTFNFEIICYEDFSFEEQVGIAMTTRNCISLHGANLSNTLFMNPGGKVMELRMKDDAENNYYYALATACDHEYYYQLCDYEMIERNGNDFTLHVDIEELRYNVANMLRA
jgi:capsular polysaccharide biosynthesis protein